MILIPSLFAELEGIGLLEDDISFPEDSGDSISDFEKRMEEKYGK